MKTLALLLAVAGSSVLAQDVAPAAPAPAPAVIQQYVYLAKLPTPAELISEAQAQGMTVSRIEQGADRIVVTYRYADGSTQTYAYRLLASAAVPVAASPAIESVTVVGAPPPRVVYVEPETVYYSSPGYVRYYDPYWSFRAPISFGINLGWHSGGYHRSSYNHRDHNRGHRGGHGGGRRH